MSEKELVDAESGMNAARLLLLLLYSLFRGVSCKSPSLRRYRERDRKRVKEIKEEKGKG
jgi:hypothetical protein